MAQEGLEHIKQWNSIHLLSEDVPTLGTCTNAMNVRGNGCWMTGPHGGHGHGWGRCHVYAWVREKDV